MQCRLKCFGTLQLEYAITDHQGNTRVVFSSATPAPVAPKATFEGDANDNSDQFELDENFVVTSLAANHTTSGSKVVKMNQTYKIGPAKSLKVYPGDKVDMEVWEYHEGSSGFGTSTTSASALINLVATAFGGVSGGGGESQAIYDGVSEAITGFGAGGGNQGSNRPAAYINYLLFDKDYNPLDMGYTVVPDITFTKQQLSIPTLNIEEEGYVFVYLSYDNDSPNWVYFDDFKVTHTKSNVIQYNEYYPFGLQTSNSWTRESNENNFLYNAGSEINTTSGLYDLPFRNYDAALGRFFQVDPLAHLDNSTSPFAYGANNPVYFNDPMGLQASGGWSEYNRYAVPTNRADAMSEWGNEWSHDFTGSYASVTSAQAMSIWGLGAGGVNSRIYSPWGGKQIGTDKDGNPIYKGAWIRLYSEEGQALLNNKHGADDRVIIRDFPGVIITITNQIVGETYVKGYPDQVVDDAGSKVIYQVPLYEVRVSGSEDGKFVSQTFKAIRFGVHNKNGKKPFVTGVKSGVYAGSWGTMTKLGVAIHVEGAGRGDVWIHVGPANNYVPGANGCVEICGDGEWSFFNNFINNLAGSRDGIMIKFETAAAPPLIPKTLSP